MRKWTKRFLLLAVIFCLAGGILLTIGFVSGGPEFAASTNLNTMQPFKKEERNNLRQKEVNLEAFTRLHIDLEDRDLTIRPSDDASAHLTYTCNPEATADTVTCTTKENTLYLSDHASGTSGAFFHIDYSFLTELFGSGRKEILNKDTVTLYLPAQQLLEDTAICLGDGDLRLNGLQTKKLHTELTYGDLHLSKSSAEHCTITLGDGDGLIEELSSKNARFTFTYGDLTLKDSSLENITASLSDGDVTAENTRFSGKGNFQLSYGDACFLLTDEQKDSLSLDLSTALGSLSAPDAGQQYTDTDSSRYTRTGLQPGQKLTIHCSDGDISLQ